MCTFLYLCVFLAQGGSQAPARAAAASSLLRTECVTQGERIASRKRAEDSKLGIQLGAAPGNSYLSLS